MSDTSETPSKETPLVQCPNCLSYFTEHGEKEGNPSEGDIELHTCLSSWRDV